jgi:hypothetical protein
MTNAQEIKPKQLDPKQQSAYRAMLRQTRHLLAIAGANAGTVDDLPKSDVATDFDENRLADLLYHVNQAVDIIDAIKPKKQA